MTSNLSNFFLEREVKDLHSKSSRLSYQNSIQWLKKNNGID